MYMYICVCAELGSPLKHIDFFKCVCCVCVNVCFWATLLDQCVEWGSPWNISIFFHMSMCVFWATPFDFQYVWIEWGSSWNIPIFYSSMCVCVIFFGLLYLIFLWIKWGSPWSISIFSNVFWAILFDFQYLRIELDSPWNISNFHLIIRENVRVCVCSKAWCIMQCSAIKCITSIVNLAWKRV